MIQTLCHHHRHTVIATKAKERECVMTLQIATTTHFLCGMLFLCAFLRILLTAEPDVFARKATDCKNLFDKLFRNTWQYREIIPTKLFLFQTWMIGKNLCFLYLQNQITMTDNIHILAIITIMIILHIIYLSYMIWKSERLNETALWLSFVIPTTVGVHLYCLQFVMNVSDNINDELYLQTLTAGNYTLHEVNDIIEHNQNVLLFRSCFALQCIIDYLIGRKEQQNDVVAIQQEPEIKKKTEKKNVPGRRKSNRKRSKTPVAKKKHVSTTA